MVHAIMYKWHDCCNTIVITLGLAALPGPLPLARRASNIAKAYHFIKLKLKRDGCASTGAKKGAAVNPKNMHLPGPLVSLQHRNAWRAS